MDQSAPLHKLLEKDGLVSRSFFHFCVVLTLTSQLEHLISMETESLQNREGRCDESVSFSSASNELSDTIPSMPSCRTSAFL